MYYVIWWDAYGDPHQSELMSRETAMVFARNMHPSQEAMLVYVRGGRA